MVKFVFCIFWVQPSEFFVVMQLFNFFFLIESVFFIFDKIPALWSRLFEMQILKAKIIQVHLTVLLLYFDWSYSSSTIKRCSCNSFLLERI